MVQEGASKFKFVSPGIQVAEVDNSQLPKAEPGDGPVIIGRTQRGPGLRPVSLNSFSEFVELYGNPIPGGRGGDVWREGNYLGPTYGAYAAKGWFKRQKKITFVRLLGVSHEDATTAGAAGWQIGSSHDASLSSGGAFGLFIIDSGTAGSTNHTGSLAAIWYLNEGSIELSGTNRDGNAVTGTAVLIESQGTNKEFKALIKDSTGAITDTKTFNFVIGSDKYARTVFNTNPTVLNTNITNTNQLQKYFLGETFDRHLEENVTGTAAGAQFGVILSLQSGSYDQNIQRMSMQKASTGWFISQDLESDTGSYDPANMTRLFRLRTHDAGEWEMKNLKISIEDVKASTNQDEPYGTFSIVIRKAQDSDNAPQVVERFTQCNLNPFSPNYVAAKIGDRYMEWSDTQRRFREFGNHTNLSRFVYVEMNADVDAGATTAELLPFGVLGPVRFKGFTIVSGSSEAHDFGTSVTGASTPFTDVFAQGNADIVGSKGDVSHFVDVGSGVNSGFTGSFEYPALPLRTSTRVGNLANPQEAYFGSDSSRQNSVRFEKSYADVVRRLPDSIDDDVSNPSLEYSFKFSLDDVSRLGSVDAQWAAGTRAAGTSFTATTGTYSAVLEAGFDRFTVPLAGGFDGVDITEKEPFNNRKLSGQTQITSYEFNSIKRAIDSVADPEVVDMNLMVAPGITNTGITDHMLNVAEARADTLAIVDIEGGFIPSTENASGDGAAANRGDVDTTISNLRNRALNTSYGCCYYPWLQIRDEESQSKLWCPPSAVMLGVLGSSEAETDAWIAPAGFTRGGLTEGAAGIPVTFVRERLDKKQRDKLYEANINPIGTFPNEGILVLGQKTLQVTRSALDRINVRRLMIYLKKAISRVANTILFDQNINSTWKRFIGQARPILKTVKARFGLEEFKLILDESTTTADLRDRNIMYAKVFCKPAKAIEFIALDFVITNSGASFED